MSIERSTKTQYYGMKNCNNSVIQLRESILNIVKHYQVLLYI